MELNNQLVQKLSAKISPCQALQSGTSVKVMMARSSASSRALTAGHETLTHSYHIHQTLDL
jgi:ribonucleotide monophosphatase NagD (HAD superfamily)